MLVQIRASLRCNVFSSLLWISLKLHWMDLGFGQSLIFLSLSLAS